MRLKGRIAPGSGYGAFFTGQRLSPLAIRFIRESYLAVSSVIFKVVSVFTIWAEAAEIVNANSRRQKVCFKIAIVVSCKERNLYQWIESNFNKAL